MKIVCICCDLFDNPCTMSSIFRYNEHKERKVAMILHKKQKEFLMALETVKEQYIKQAIEVENIFYRGFYIQCMESTAADIYEVCFLDFSQGNCFRNSIRQEQLKPFFKLAAIHHSICTAKRRKKQITWQEIRSVLQTVYALSEKEMQLADRLYHCMEHCKSNFSELFAKVTLQYLHIQPQFHIFTLAFLLHFWYNSYRSFMASFAGYVPFHVRLQKTSAM